jgi:hypothetical protein
MSDRYALARVGRRYIVLLLTLSIHSARGSGPSRLAHRASRVAHSEAWPQSALRLDPSLSLLLLVFHCLQPQATRHAVGGACRLCSLSSSVMDHQPKYENETTTFAAVDQARLKAADDERNPIPLSFHQSAYVESRPLTRLPASG